MSPSIRRSPARFAVLLFASIAGVVPSGCTLELNRALEAGEVRGRAVSLGADGKPTGLVDAVVRVEGTPITVKSDAQGRFRVRGLPAGRYGLRIDAAAVGLAVRLRGLPLETALDLGDVVLGRLGALEGEVVRDGSEVRGSVVLAGTRQVAIAGGRVRVDGLAPGEFQVVVLAEGAGLFDLGTVTVAAGTTTTLTFDLTGKTPLESFGLSGTALLSGADDHSGIAVRALGTETAGATTSKDGLYADALVPAGVYTLVAHKDGFRDQVAANVPVGGDLDVPTLVLLPTGTTCEAGGLAVSAEDKDGDGTPDADEDAVCVCTQGTQDLDEDGLCEDTDPDLDGDGVPNLVDVCPVVADEDQDDADADGLGDACDPLCGEENEDCSTRDDACSEGYCDPGTRTCATRSNGAETCDDGDPCTSGDSCGEGGCHGRAIDCSESAGTCRTASCDALTGQCVTATADDGTECDDTSPCTFDDACFEGQCDGTPVDCSGSSDTCNAGACDELEGTCVAVPRTGEITCNDRDVCTTADFCDSGTCRGSAVDCSEVSDGECSVGTCLLGEGGGPECRANSVVDGTPCTDTNPCTYGTGCNSGWCGPAGTCTPLDVYPAKVAGAVSPSVGQAPFADACGEGFVAVGITGRLAGEPNVDALVDLRIVCADPFIDGSGGYHLALSEGPSVPGDVGRGFSQGVGGFSLDCGTDQLLTAVSVAFRPGGGVSGLRIACADATYVDSRAEGPHLVLTPAGGSTFPATTTQFDFTAACPAGAVVTGQAGEEDALVGAYGVLCGTPTLDLAHETPRMAGVGGGGVIDECPGGLAPVGFTARTSFGFYPGILCQFFTRCAQVQVLGTGQGTLDIGLAGGTVTRLPAANASPPVRGTWTSNDGTDRTTDCPAGTMLVGLTVEDSPIPNTVNGVHRLFPRCAPVTLTGDPDVGYVASWPSPTTGTALGTSGGTVSTTYDCPPGTVATGLTVNAGEIVDGLRLRCARPQMPAAL